MMHARSAASPVEGDLTPMIDVTFLLLVFFLCTLSFEPLEGRLEALLPRDGGEARERDLAQLLEPLELDLQPDPTRSHGVRVQAAGRGALSVEALAPLVRELLARNPDLRARIAAAPGVTYGMAVAVLDACLAAGLRDVGFAAS
jgi:biopolymer transport protein ExbD